MYQVTTMPYALTGCVLVKQVVAGAPTAVPNSEFTNNPHNTANCLSHGRSARCAPQTTMFSPVHSLYFPSSSLSRDFPISLVRTKI